MREINNLSQAAPPTRTWHRSLKSWCATTQAKIGWKRCQLCCWDCRPASVKGSTLLQLNIYTAPPCGSRASSLSQSISSRTTRSSSRNLGNIWGTWGRSPWPVTIKENPFCYRVLVNTTHFFLHWEDTKSLEGLYSGPYKVVERNTDRVYTILRNGREVAVNVERLKPLTWSDYLVYQEIVEKSCSIGHTIQLPVNWSSPGNATQRTKQVVDQDIKFQVTLRPLRNLIIYISTIFSIKSCFWKKQEFVNYNNRVRPKE